MKLIQYLRFVSVAPIFSGCLVSGATTSAETGAVGFQDAAMSPTNTIDLSNSEGIATKALEMIDVPRNISLCGKIYKKETANQLFMVQKNSRRWKRYTINYSNSLEEFSEITSRGKISDYKLEKCIDSAYQAYSLAPAERRGDKEAALKAWISALDPLRQNFKLKSEVYDLNDFGPSLGRISHLKKINALGDLITANYNIIIRIEF